MATTSNNQDPDRFPTLKLFSEKESDLGLEARSAFWLGDDFFALAWTEPSQSTIFPS